MYESYTVVMTNLNFSVYLSRQFETCDMDYGLYQQGEIYAH